MAGPNTPWVRHAGGRSPKQLLVAGRFALSAAAEKASLDMSTCNAQLDNVVTAVTPGVAGNAITLKVIGDSPAAGGVTISRSGTDFVAHFESGVSTQGALNTAINALLGADKLIEVLAGDEGTEATVLVNGRAYCETDDWSSNLNSVIQAGFNTGAAGDAYTFGLAASGIAKAGEMMVDQAHHSMIFKFKPGAPNQSTVADFEAAIGALAGDDAFLEVKTAGTGANTLNDLSEDVCCFLANGTDTHAEQAATHLTGGLAEGDVTLVGGAEVESVEHVSEGVYRLTMRDRFAVRLDCVADIEAAAVAAYEAKVSDYVAASRTVDIHILDQGTTDLADPDVGDGIVCHFQMWFGLMEG